MRVLLTEGASLTARETLGVLGARGVRSDVLTPGGVCLARFSRWTHRCLRVPEVRTDPLGYLAAVGRLSATGGYAAVLPTHEQAWLLAAGRHLLPEDAPIAVAPFEAFMQVQGKLELAALLDRLEVPQPRWWRVGEARQRRFPYWLKASHSTAGRGVRLVHDASEEAAAIAALGDAELMGQEPAPGQYGQVQALFEHGRLAAVHTNVQVGSGAGGSAAARLSVDHPLAREHVARLGEHLGWHGGITLDYLHVDGRPRFIECNPRTVEPGNAARSGVDLPSLTIDLSRGRPLPDRVVVGRPGVRTRSALALALGAAEAHGSRRAVLGVLAGCAGRRGENGAAAEVLTPVLRDPPSALPLALVSAALLARPSSVSRLARGAVDGYSVPPEAVTTVRRAGTDGPRP